MKSRSQILLLAKKTKARVYVPSVSFNKVEKTDDK